MAVYIGYQYFDLLVVSFIRLELMIITLSRNKSKLL